MRITFYGAAQTVTGSCHVVEAANKKIMIDCGLFQGHREARERNYLPFAMIPQTVDYLLISHAHIDHSGLVPKLYKHGFHGRALAAETTRELLEVLLPDSGHIQEMEVERLNRKGMRSGKKLLDPIYTAEDALECVKYIERVKYNQVISLDENITVRFMNAGHILGSSIIEVWVREGAEQTKLVFSGDLGATGKPFVKEPTIIEDADYLVMECTYGDRIHQDQGDRLEKLLAVIKQTYEKGGNLVIPAFAVERTQDLLYDINRLLVNGQLPPMPVYVDSPMAVAATEIFKRNYEHFDSETTQFILDGDNPLTMPMLHLSSTVEDSRAINEIKGGAIIISASGMADAGRIKHHLKHNLWRPESTVLFVGYQAPGTKGQRLQSGVSSIRLLGEEVTVRADIRSIDGYSCHADQQELLNWMNAFKQKPTQVFLVHGNPEALAVMEKLVEERIGIDAYIPAWQETVEITPGVEFSPEELQRAYQAMVAKMDSFLHSTHTQKDMERVMDQFKQLESLLDKVPQAG